MSTRTHRPRSRVALAALLGASISCAHAPAAPAAPLPEVVWPAPPAAPRLRLVAVLPDPSAPPPRRSFWERLGEAIAGTTPEERTMARLVRPFGVAAAADGTIYVADPDAPGVLRLGPAGDLTPVTCRGREWGAPMSVALGPAGELWIADAGAAEVVVVATDGTCRALGTGALERPTGLALLDGRVVVADPPRHELAVLSPAGAVEAHWAGDPVADDPLHFPTAVASSADSVLVVDALNFRVLRLGPDGRRVASLGAPGEEGSGLARPKGVAEDAAGRVYVADAQRDLVLVFDADGRFDYAAGASGAAPGEFRHPAGLAIVRDRLYVADSQNGRVQVFAILGGS
jgi:DNA-binding beta-propeller fold protein YncE